MERWQLDELAHAGDEHLDPAYVAGYERKAGYDPVADLVVLRRHGLGPDSTVVDLGAGTGGFAIACAAECEHVTAVDISPAMVAILRGRVREAGLDNVTVIEGRFLTYNHVGMAPDFIFTRNALHQIPDFWKGIALERIRDLLAPAGVLHLHDLIFDFEPRVAAERLEAWMAGAVTDPAVGFTADELADHVRLEHSTYGWIFDVMLERTGFEILERDYRRSAYGMYTCRKRP